MECYTNLRRAPRSDKQKPMKRVRRLLERVTRMYRALADHFTGKDIIRADRENADLAEKRAHIRVAALREKFRSVRELSEKINARIDEYKNRRAG